MDIVEHVHVEVGVNLGLEIAQLVFGIGFHEAFALESVGKPLKQQCNHKVGPYDEKREHKVEKQWQRQHMVGHRRLWMRSGAYRNLMCEVAILIRPHKSQCYQCAYEIGREPVAKQQTRYQQPVVNGEKYDERCQSHCHADEYFLINRCEAVHAAVADGDEHIQGYDQQPQSDIGQGFVVTVARELHVTSFCLYKVRK